MKEYEDIIEKLISHLNNDFIIVGSVSMVLNGIDIVPSKKEIDIEITDERYFETLKLFGEYHTINENGERTPFKEKKRMFIKTENLFIDVYLCDHFSPYIETTINGKNVKIRDKNSYIDFYSNILENYDFEKYDTQGFFIKKIKRYLQILS